MGNKHNTRARLEIVQVNGFGVAYVRLNSVSILDNAYMTKKEWQKFVKEVNNSLKSIEESAGEDNEQSQ